MKVALAAVLVASVALLSGCGTENAGAPAAAASPSAAPSPSKSVSATEQLAEAAKLSASGPHKFAFKIGDIVNASGATDPAAKKTTLKLGFDIEGLDLSFDYLLVGTTYYVKLSGVPLPGVNLNKWLKLDPAKITSAEAFGLGGAQDVTGMQDTIKAVVTAERAGDKQITGTIDLTKTSSGYADEDELKALGDKAKAVPFVATLDDQGRLTGIKVTVPGYTGADGAVEEQVIDITYTDLGTAVQIAEPAPADVMDAPASLYELIND